MSDKEPTPKRPSSNPAPKKVPLHKQPLREERKGAARPPKLPTPPKK